MTRRYTPLLYIIIPLILTAASHTLDPLAVSMARDIGITAVARLFSTLGNGGVLSLLCVALTIAGFALKKENLRDAGWKSLAALIFATILLHILKAAFERPRMAHLDGALLYLLENPSIFDLTGRYNSFPSGHTMVTFTVAATLAFYYPRMAIILYPLAALVGLSRVYLGSHYPSDVVAGAFLGIGFTYLLTRNIIVERWRECLLLTAAVVMAYFKLGGFILFDVDEAVFSEATREMVTGGDYITPMYNSLPRYDKPILFYWLMSMAFGLFGVSEFAARFTSATLGVGLIIMTYLFVKRIKGERAAFWSGLCLLLNLEFFLYTHSAVTDMTLTFFITASLFSLFLGLEGGKVDDATQSDSGRWYALFWISSALAVLTKGAIGLLFPVTIAGLYLIATGNIRRVWEILRIRYLLLFIIVAAPWFVAQFYINGWEFYDAFIVKHHFKRYTGVISGHSGPPWFYLGILLAGFFPWLFFLPGSVTRGLRERGVHRFCALWFLFILAFFSISKTKLPNYILPLFPAMGVMVGIQLSELVRNRGRIPFYFIAGISLLVASALFLLPLMAIKMEIAYSNSFFYLLGAIFLIISIFAFLKTKGHWSALGGIALFTALLLIFIRTYGLPPANLHLQGSLHAYATYSRGVLERDDILATYDINQPSILFYARRGIEKIEGGNKDYFRQLPEDRRVLVITRAEKVAELRVVAELILVDSDEKYALLTNHKGLPPLQKRRSHR